MDPFEEVFLDTKVGPPPMIELGGGKPGFGYALFPNVPALPTPEYQDAWEERARLMHENQSQIDINSLPEKGSNKPMPERKTYHELMGKAPPPKFEDQPESVRRGLHRGD